ncbi:YaaC family protein [Salinithrix halophila]|uniref:YaaC family protein n=1 Tax=Salinithrix halophila TaxID=1485204 RepID=A0ABV8JFT3_9BACL
METGTVRRIPCESPEQKMWNLYLLLENETTAKRFLTEKYRRNGVEHPERAAFRASHALISHVRQARELYRAARESQLLVSPLLAYYGVMNLSKAWMLSFDPEFPRNASVMRHGASTRRRKRSDYRFFSDEVRAQRDGLFPELARKTGRPVLTGESWTMKSLLALVPELQDGFRQIFHEVSLYPIAVPERIPVISPEMPFTFEERVLEVLHLPPRRLAERLNGAGREGGARFSCGPSAQPQGRVRLLWSHPDSLHVNHWNRGFSHPWFREDLHGNHYLFPPAHGSAPVLPELFVHYLLLFSLSMLCRYEAPLWGEMIGGSISEEIVLIEEFLQVTLRKFPNLILNALFEEKILFIRS